MSFRETIRQRAEFNYLHKKQSGGSGEREGGGVEVTARSVDRLSDDCH